MTSRQYGLFGDLTPYDRMLQLTAEPGEGKPTLRALLTQMVSSPIWDDLSAGAEVASGGAKYSQAADLIQGYRQEAFQRVQQEFPELRRAILQAQNTKKAAFTQGEAGVKRIQDVFTTPPQK